MLKNKLYVYSTQEPKIPVHINFGQHLLHNIWSQGDTIAIVNADTGETLTYRDFAQQIVNVALSLKRLGVTKGQCVSICSEKRLEFLPTLLGIISAGATFAPADVTCGKATLLHRVNLVKPTIMFCSPVGWSTHKESLRSVDSLKTFIVFGDQADGAHLSFQEFLSEQARVEDFLATPVDGLREFPVILYSSGTTGLPKGIPLTHLNFITFIEALIDARAYRGLSVMNTREWYYSYGMVYTLACLNAGATVVYSPKNQVEDFLKAIAKYKIKAIQLAPPTIVEMVKSPLLAKYDVSSLERMLSASTPASAELVNNAKSKFPNLREVYQLYGISEAGSVCTEETSTKGTKSGSVGQPGFGAILKVVDQDTRKPLGPMQRGEICVYSSSLTPGYLHQTSRDHLDEEGFFLTGDIGYYDEDGYFFIVNRIKELIKFNSFQVAPAELESVLQEHPSVLEAGVIGAPHEKFGEVPLAFVALQPGATITADELVAYVDTQVSSRMRLEGGVRFVDALPRGAAALLCNRIGINMIAILIYNDGFCTGSVS